MNAKMKIKALREQMKANGVDFYLVFTEDFHESEYVGDYFKGRSWLTGFNGSAGTALVTEKEACLWTDGRYFLQAAEQLEGSDIVLQKMGEEGVPTILEYIKENMAEGQCIGMDGRCASIRMAKDLTAIAEEKNGSVKYQLDLLDEIWEDRPALSAEPVFELAEEYCGELRSAKLARMRELMGDLDAFVITTLDDIAWLLNLRGNDVAYNPVFFSYIVLEKEAVQLFVNETILSEEIKAHLTEDGVMLHPYNDIYDYVAKFPAGTKVGMDEGRSNYAMYKNIPADVELTMQTNITLLPKATKNPTECANMRKAHVKDGVAVTKFMCWLKKNFGKIPMTELSCAAKMLEFRKEQENFLEESFSPIVSVGPHGAMMHYSPNEESDTALEAGKFLLADTGAQFLEGTTDITRTFALGEISEEMRDLYTIVLRANLSLTAVKFKYGCNGKNFDYVARKPFWDRGLDFNHGTGHGIGCLLNVHEGPNGFRYREIPGRSEMAVFEPGMITTNEPGYYKDGHFGIRLENCIVCEEGEKTVWGRFLKFSALTMVPFDLDAVDVSAMSLEEIRLLNEYHTEVYETIAPHLNEEEAEWLKYATRKVG